MKKNLMILCASLTALTLAAQQHNQPDSIRVNVMVNENGNVKVIDTIVPVSQKQDLMTWMTAQGIDVPAAPGDTVRTEETIILLNDSGETTLPGKQRCKVMMVHGDSGDVMMKLPPLPPVPPVPPVAPGAPKPPVPPNPPMRMIIIEDSAAAGNGRQVIIVKKQQSTAANAGSDARKATVAPGDPGTKLTVFPNPSSSVITVDFDMSGQNSAVLTVTDANGKTVYSEKITGAPADGKVTRQLDLGENGKGMYVVSVEMPGEKLTGRVLIK